MGIGLCRPRWEALWGKVTTATVYLAFAMCQWLTRIIMTLVYIRYYDYYYTHYPVNLWNLQ